MTSIQKAEVLAAEISLNASLGGGGRMSVAVSSMPKAASKLVRTGELISISSMVLLAGGLKRTPVARIGLPFAATLKRCRKYGVKPGCALRYRAVAMVAQPLVGFEELMTT